MIKTYCLDENYSYDYYRGASFDFYFGHAKRCVLDIETTGLSAENSTFVLGGLLSFTDKQANLRQFFAENTPEEKALLEAYLSEVRKYDVLLTYNGRRFDIPFLQKRAEILGVDASQLPYNLDLYLVLQQHSALRKFLPNLQQKTIENFMGLWSSREDIISGRESAMLYQEYLLRREYGEDTLQYVDTMLLHNRDDVLQLGKLLPVLEKVDLHGAMFALGFPIISDGCKTVLSIEKIKISDFDLTVQGRQTRNPFEYVLFGDADREYSMIFNQAAASFQIRIPIARAAGALFLDLKRIPGFDLESFSAYPNFESGYLVIQNKNNINTIETNRFIKMFLQNILEESAGGI